MTSAGTDDLSGASAGLKAIVQEAELQGLRTWLRGLGEQDLVAAWLLHTEMRCAVQRRPKDLDLTDVAPCSTSWNSLI